MSEGHGDELADRVTALEQQQRADRRALGSLDADVSDLQQQRRQDVRLFQSIRDTQIEHGRRLGGIDGRLDGIDGHLGGIDRHLGGIDGHLGGIDGRLDRLESGMADMRSGMTEMRSSLSLVVELLRPDAG